MKKLLSIVCNDCNDGYIISWMCKQKLTTPAPTPAPAASGDKVYKVAFIARAQSDSFAAWLANAVKEEAAKYQKH